MEVDFETSPFTGTIFFNNEEIQQVKSKLLENKELSSNIQILNFKNKKDSNIIEVSLEKNDKIEIINILKNEIKIEIENKKPFAINTIEQCLGIVNQLGIKYNINIDGNNNIDFTEIDYTKIKIIKADIKKNEFDIFKNFTFRKDKLTKDITKGIKYIKKELFSLNFGKICKHDESQDTFNLVIDENRIQFIESINDFLEKNDYLFYWILGTDGIGKSITILYYTMTKMIKINYKKIYFNLKSFVNAEKELVETLFFNELMRLFITEEENDIKMNYSTYKYYKEETLKIITEESTGIQYFWLLLFNFLKIYTKIIKNNQHFLLILDQYKLKKIDANFKNLNNLAKNIKNYNLTFKFKFILICSINNFDIKDEFLDSLFFLSFDTKIKSEIIPVPNYNSENLEDNLLIEKKNKENIIEIENSECSNIEEYLNREYENINKQFKEYILNKGRKNNNIYSKCILNSAYSENTKKVYYNNMSNCKSIIDNNLGEICKDCIKIFGYSLKYYQLLMDEINKGKKQNKDESRDNYEKRIVKSFYQNMSVKINQNIDYYYSNLLNKEKKDIIDLQKYECKYLYELRNIIYNEKTFTLGDICSVLKNFPNKYLNLYIAFSESNNIPIQTNDLSKFTFYFDYSNNFIRHIINKKLDILNNKLEGSGFGWEFEEKANNALSEYKYLKLPLFKRNIFSLVKIKNIENTKEYIKKLRKLEDKEFYEFFELKKYNINLDDIDGIKNFTVIDNNIFLNQISKTGLNFDSAILLKIDKDNDGYTHYLILFQMTKYKVGECKTKENYTNSAIIAKENLESIYTGLKIKKIYFIFIIPSNDINLEQTIKKLNKENIYYLKFDFEKSQFFNNNKNEVTNFIINEAEVNESNIDLSVFKTVNDISNSLIMLNKAVKQFLSKKSLYEGKFINAYNKIYKENDLNIISIKIPTLLKENIVKQLIIDKYFFEKTNLIFWPSSNCEIENLLKVFELTNNLILFSDNNNIYYYYNDLYEIDDLIKYSIKKSNLTIDNFIGLDLKEINRLKRPTKNIKMFVKIKDYPRFCFCFNIIQNFKFNYKFI